METSEIKEIVKNSVRTAIKTCGTQAALAKKAGITQGAVGKYLRGEAIPTGVTALNLSKAVNDEQPPSDFAPHIFTSYSSMSRRSTDSVNEKTHTDRKS